MSPKKSPFDPPEAEPVAEAIRGYRALRVRARDGAFLTINGRDLAEGPEHPAFCDHALKGYNERSDHEAPEWDCSCGYYALQTLRRDALERWSADVELWGRVIEHEWGWRAQYQRLVRIYAPGTCCIDGCCAAAELLVRHPIGDLFASCGNHQSAWECVPAPASLLADPRITWGNVDPAGPPPPTLAAEVAKLAKAVTFLGTSGRGVRPIPREVAAMVPAGTTIWVNDLQATNPVYRPQLCIEHHQEGWRMILLAPTGMIMWDTIVPYAAGPDPRFG